MSIRIDPLRGHFNATVSVPGSKSIANRAIILAAVARGVTMLTNVPDSTDIRDALRAVQGLGVRCTPAGEGAWCIQGCGGVFPRADAALDIGSSGTVGRFLPGLLAAQTHGRWTLNASEQLRRRPLTPLLDALRAWGGAVSTPQGASFPLEIAGAGLREGAVDISARQSSQFASGLLMAAPLSSGPVLVRITDIDPAECYIDITLHMQQHFGVEIANHKHEATQVAYVLPQQYAAQDLHIEPDFNSALYFLSIPLVSGGQCTVRALQADSLQPGAKFLDVLRRLGADITADGQGIRCSAQGGPLHGGWELDMRALSEMALTLGVLAVFADAPITMRNLGHIRGHETDRLALLQQLLGQAGARAEQDGDDITIWPADRGALAPVALDTHNDHRIAMSFALLGLGANGIALSNPEAVRKTYPEFFAHLAAAGAGVHSVP